MLNKSETQDGSVKANKAPGFRAYAAAIYMVIPGCISRLIMAKTKIAPAKLETLPLLELCGAELLVKLTKQILSNVEKQPEQVHFWCDSKVLLDWLDGHPSRWQTFVANRVSFINSSYPNAVWHHAGPNWLTAPAADWQPFDGSSEPEEAEVHAFLVQEEAKKEEDEDIVYTRLRRISSFPRILKVLGYCGRWLARFRLRTVSFSNCIKLTTDEIYWARTACFKLIQQRWYGKELELLKKKKPLIQKSELFRLSPFLDDQDLIRLTGRLHNAPIPFSERHPIILPGSDEIVKRLVEENHRATLHGGVQLLISHLQQSFWITGMRRLVSGVCRRCMRCTRFRAKTSQQQMAPLPVDRLTPQRAFTFTGLDYAGPFTVPFSKRRKAITAKGYIAILVCMTYKAVHIEAVSDLTTEAFLAAYSRFAARRGVCKKLFSDNGTNFKGASSEIARMFAEAWEFYSSVASHLAMQGTEWKFIPPRAPHFSGLWEAAVKSFKYHFRRVVGASVLTFEELSTLAAKIEACLNSRPLCKPSIHASDLLALTPGHFLNGAECLALPEVAEEAPRGGLSKGWRLLSQLRNSFWTRWKKEVIQQLAQRNKWLELQPNYKVGDVVIIKDEFSSPARWPLGLVTAVHSGKDGMVRVVTLRIGGSTLMRRIVKLVKLPMDEDGEEPLE
ncbi:hypothetical protein TKK_0000126 [Trichogramma kaykai]